MLCSSTSSHKYEAESCIFTEKLLGLFVVPRVVDDGCSNIIPFQACFLCVFQGLYSELYYFHFFFIDFFFFFLGGGSCQYTGCYSLVNGNYYHVSQYQFGKYFDKGRLSCMLHVYFS
jgi:hypothetical protein